MNKTKELTYWITERYTIKLLKESGLPPPWTEDPAMANVRYCNVHREDDKVTRWIAEHWRNPNAASPRLTEGMVIARMVNLPETLSRIGFPHAGADYFYRDHAKDVMRRLASQGQKIWTSAYTISTCGRRMAKEEYVFDHVVAQVHALKWEWEKVPTLAEAHAMLTSVDGLGSFLGAQVVADLRNAPGHPLSRATDAKLWAAPGPGSLRGLNWYFYGRPDGPITVTHFAKKIYECYQEVMEALAVDTTTSVPPIHMQDFQNCLCEFSKYMRVTTGDARVRNKYRPRQD